MLTPDNDAGQKPPPGFTRRSALIAIGAVAGMGVVGFEVATPASAEIMWGHPFTFYSSRSRGFTGQWPQGHAGIDYTPGASTPIHAVADGYIYYSVPDHPNYGHAIFMDHGGGYTSRYAHMEAGTRVQGAQWVARGTYLGKVGNTGHSFGAHLHVEVLRGDTALNPDPLIDRNRTAPLAGSAGSTPPIAPGQTQQEDDMPKIIYRQDTGGTYMIGEGGVSRLVNARANEMLNYIGIPGSQWVNQLGKNDFRQVVEAFGFDYGQVAALAPGQRVRADGAVVNAGGAGWPPSWA